MHLIYPCPVIEYIVNIVKNAQTPQTSNMILLCKYGLETTQSHIRITGNYKHNLFIIIIELHHKYS